MESLIRKNRSSSRWCPQSVDKYRGSINIPYDSPEHKRLKNNFAYNMQYIEYLEKQIEELNLTSVLTKMLYKSYIITGMGIIELLFVYILKANDYWKKTEWESVSQFVSNSKEIEGNIIKTETQILKKVSPHDMRMDLDSMIKSVEKKNILSINHNVFPALKKLRELRNRVHLQLGESAYDHDYNTINLEEIQMMRRILFAVLSATEICNDIDTFTFINDYYEKYKN